MKEYEVVIIGGGVTGTSLLYTLSNFTNIKSLALIEKEKNIARINSNSTNNSQTLHFGDIETNYSKEKAIIVKEAAELVAGYVEKNGTHLFNKTKKMVLAVGDDEVKDLENRYHEINDIFPKLKKIDRKEIALIEPNIVKGRKPKQKILALCSEDGYAINYRKLSKSFVEKSLKTNKTIDLMMNTKVEDIKKENKEENYIIKIKKETNTNKETISAKVVVVCAGAHSLILARKLGHGKNLIIFPALGDFYTAKNALNNKVYTMQIKKIPFAAIHGDPDVENPSLTRFGPTTKVLPILERRNPKTFFDFLQVFDLRLKSLKSIFNILYDKDIFPFVMRNFLYEIPFIGKRIFMKNIWKIIPSIKTNEVTFGKKIGGLRPQLVDRKERKLCMGEVKIIKENIIFNMTPSPGASVCLKNAQKDAITTTSFLGLNFDEKRFLKKHRR
jgi:malate dehydrogenase (quinone)